MACLKCGKETEEGQVFCPDCRDVMQRYPVKPGSMATIPKRPAIPEERKAPRKVRTEEREKMFKSLIRWLVVLTGVLTIVICILCGLLLMTLSDNAQTENIGRNYTFVDPNATTGSTGPTTN